LSALTVFFYLIFGFLALAGFSFIALTFYMLGHLDRGIRMRDGRLVHNRAAVLAFTFGYFIIGVMLAGLGSSLLYGRLTQAPGVANGCIERSEHISTHTKGGPDTTFQTSCGTFQLGDALLLTEGAKYNFQYNRVADFFGLFGYTNQVTRIDRVDSQASYVAH
jgi:hypothetical protein